MIGPATLDQFRAIRTRHHLSIAPALVRQMRVATMPMRPVDDGNVGSKPTPRSEAPLPLNAAAVENADDLYALLVNWCTSFARTLASPPPASALRYLRLDLDAKRLPLWATPDDAAILVGDVVLWLEEHEQRIEELSTAAVWHEDVHARFGPWERRWGVGELEQQQPRMCPLCGSFAVRVRWSDGGEVYAVVCEHCGLDFEPQAYLALREAM